MAKYTLEEIMYGDKYGIESKVFMEVYNLLKQKMDTKLVREQLNMLYVKQAFIAANKMIKEGDSISDIPEIESPSLCEKRK